MTKLISIAYICLTILLYCELSKSSPLVKSVREITGNENNDDNSSGVINGSLNFNDPNSSMTKFVGNKNNGLNSKGLINGSINVDNSRSNGKPKDINLNQNVGANSESVIRGSLNSLASRGVGKEKYEGSFKIVDNGKDPLPIGNSNNCVIEGSVHYVGPDPEGFRSRCKVTGGFVGDKLP
ncbi:hypothetical protein G9A89_004885 [Geosiphon pyriformis]|nr:hypothetical protein G9A89_004885 [Geosiphon pyriformis]